MSALVDRLKDRADRDDEANLLGRAELSRTAAARIATLEAEREAAVEALRLAADTFLDFERVMDLLQRHTSADAAKVAETSIRALLAELTEREKAGD